MIKEFKDKVSVVTGAGSGIGRSLAHAFAKRGMKIVLVDVNEQSLKTVSKELTNTGADVLEMVIDVSDRSQVAELADATYDHFGKANILCNNAGVSSGSGLELTTLGDWDWVIGVNLFGVVYGIKAFFPRMLKSGEPCHIVNTSSLAGHLPGDAAPYSATKFAVVAISERLKLECFNTNVGVSVLCPGFVNTGILKNVEQFVSEREGLSQPSAERTPQEAAAMENFTKLLSSGMSPDTVAEKVIIAIQEDILHVFSHPEWLPLVENRFKNIKADVEKLDKLYSDSLKETTIVKGWKIYEHDSPSFTIKYPDDWIRLNPSQLPRAVFFASWGSNANLLITVINRTDPIVPSEFSLENAAKFQAGLLRFAATDVNIISERPATLKCGTLAHEYAVEFKHSGLTRQEQIGIMAIKEDKLINTWIGGISSDYCSADQKREILYSLEFK